MKKFLIMSGTILLILTIFIFFSAISKEQTNSTEQEINIQLSNFVSEQKRVDELFEKAAGYCVGKELTKINATLHGYDNIISGNGIVTYGFYKLVDDSAEGGYVDVAYLNVDTLKNCVVKIETFNGAGKAADISSTPIEVSEWEITLEDAINIFLSQYGKDKIKSIAKPYVSVSIHNSDFEINLFSEEQNGYLIKMFVNSKTGNFEIVY